MGFGKILICGVGLIWAILGLYNLHVGNSNEFYQCMILTTLVMIFYKIDKEE